MHAIYKRYPMMEPYFGENVVRDNAQPFLLIGESHYLPKESTQHLTAASWYNGDSTTLNLQEQGWINISQIIAGSSAEGFRNKAHSIYRKSFFEINRSGPNYSDYRRVGNDIVFYNYFLRPARTGVSLIVEEEDVRVAKEVFASVYVKYRPRAVVFLSKLAFRSWYGSGAGSLDVPVIAVPHPGCRHWNRVTASYGNRRGREVLSEFIKSVWPAGEPR